MDGLLVRSHDLHDPHLPSRDRLVPVRSDPWMLIRPEARAATISMDVATLVRPRTEWAESRTCDAATGDGSPSMDGIGRHPCLCQTGWSRSRTLSSQSCESMDVQRNRAIGVAAPSMAIVRPRNRSRGSIHGCRAAVRSQSRFHPWRVRRTRGRRSTTSKVHADGGRERLLRTGDARPWRLALPGTAPYGLRRREEARFLCRGAAAGW